MVLRLITRIQFIQPLKINGWNIIMEVWKIFILLKWVICRFHVNLPGVMIKTLWIFLSCVFVPTSWHSEGWIPARLGTKRYVIKHQGIGSNGFFAGRLNDKATVGDWQQQQQQQPQPHKTFRKSSWCFIRLFYWLSVRGALPWAAPSKCQTAPDAGRLCGRLSTAFPIGLVNARGPKPVFSREHLVCLSTIFWGK